MVHVRWRPDGQGEATGRSTVEIPADGDRDGTAAVDLATGLAPRTRYRFEVVHADGRVLGRGRFETAPAQRADAPDRFSIAVASCHQPFDAEGRLDPEAGCMLRAVRRCVERQDTKLLLEVGDQVYTDMPFDLSLFRDEHFRHVAPPGRRRIQDCTPEEVRRLVHERYRRFWNLPDWKALHAEVPCWPMLDDHDIVDNWGTLPAHRTAEWESVGAGARAAYQDYQASRIEPATPALPADFDWSFAYGPIAIYALDIRSNRRAEPAARLFSPEQESSLDRFLVRHRDREVVGLVLSVPAVHLPRSFARAFGRVRTGNEDFADRWSTAGHVVDRDRLLRRLYRQQRECPHQRIVLLSGDIHIGCIHEIRWTDGAGRFHQLVSSGITHCEGALTRHASKLAILMNRRVRMHDGGLEARVRILRGVRGQRRNPYPHLNLGLVSFARRDGGRYDVVLSIWGHRDGEPMCVFRSAPIPPPGAPA